jgi:alpha-L-fucosidase
MKKIKMIVILLFLSVVAFSQNSPNYNELMNRTQWWRDARFGMFIHFGAYSVPARGEWVKSNEKMTTGQYQKYVDVFNPVDFDAKKWAKIAKQAGMKYAVLTAKHHDGFCLFDSKLTDYKLSKQFNGRDLVREFLDAFRAEGLKVGLYYSIIDWHHNDYPNVGNHPQAGNPEWDKKTYNWDNYLKYMFGQIEELIRDYGKIDIMWFDYSFDDYVGEKWKATELLKMCRKYQPEMITDNRLDGSGDNYSLTFGDFITPEQAIPETSIKDVNGRILPWETCLTLNNHWGYCETDNDWKPSEVIIRSLVDCVSKNGNLLLNVGPDGKGNIPKQSIEILTEVGDWMQKNGESIYGCGQSDLTKPDWGYFTQKGNNLFAHWCYPKIGPINVKGISKRVKMTTLLSTGTELAVSRKWWGYTGVDDWFINLAYPIQHTYLLPDKADAVVKIELK